jgi:hypothetical protein
MESVLRRIRDRVRRELTAVKRSFAALMATFSRRREFVASQRMCPFCGLITPISQRLCLECGKEGVL